MLRRFDSGYPNKMEDINYTKKLYELEMKKKHRDEIIGIGILILISPFIIVILAIVF